ncbi:MAG: hypothetical protein R2879_13175 [Saprospiraceae bacterium]
MKIFANIMAVYFLLGSFFPRTDFSQLAKVPNIFKHYECHVLESKAKHVKPDFTKFLTDHFFGSLEHEHQDQSHHQLPLKTINLDFQFLVTKQANLLIKNLLNLTQRVFSTNNLIGVDFTLNLFHPPIHS